MILARLTSVGIKFDDEVQALLLLLSLSDSWSGTVTTVTSSAGSNGFTFEKICDHILGEDVRRRSQSKTWNCSSVTCWNSKEVGPFSNQCPNDK